MTSLVDEALKIRQKEKEVLDNLDREWEEILTQRQKECKDAFRQLQQELDSEYQAENQKQEEELKDLRAIHNQQFSSVISSLFRNEGFSTSALQQKINDQQKMSIMNAATDRSRATTLGSQLRDADQKYSERIGMLYAKIDDQANVIANDTKRKLEMIEKMIEEDASFFQKVESIRTSLQADMTKSANEDDIRGQIMQLQSDIESLQEQYNTLKKRKSNIEKMIQATQSDCDDLECLKEKLNDDHETAKKDKDLLLRALVNQFGPDLLDSLQSCTPSQALNTL